MSYLTEFPDFAPADMPAIPAGFVDVSWHQDSCPSFFHAAVGLTVQIDHVDRDRREFPDGPRFAIFESDADGARIDGGFEFESDVWADVVAEIMARVDLVAHCWTRKDTGGGLRPWTRMISDGRTIFLADDEGGNLGARGERCSFSVWRGDVEIDSQSADDLAQALTMIASLDADDPSKKSLPAPDDLAGIG